MNAYEFINEVRNLYLNARLSRYPYTSLRRGKSHSISGEIEDLFAKEIAEYCPNTSVLVNFEFHYLDNNQAKFTPDISVVIGNRIAFFVELKMDTGWNRDGLIEYCQERMNRIIRAKKAGIYYLDNGERRDIGVTDNAKLLLVIISGINGGPRFSEQLIQINAIPTVSAYVLSDGLHPNTRNKNLEGISIKEDAYNSIFKEINAF